MAIGTIRAITAIGAIVIIEIYERDVNKNDLFNVIDEMKQHTDNYIYVLCESINRHPMKNNIKEYLINNGYTYTKNILVNGKSKRGYKKMKQLVKLVAHILQLGESI